MGHSSCAAVHSDGLPQLRVVDLATLAAHDVPLPQRVGQLEGGLTRLASAPAFRFSFASPLHPPSTYDYHFATR